MVKKPMKLGYNHQRGQNLKVARRSKRGLKEKNESPKKKRKVQCGEESPKKLKASREGRTMTCGSCGITGISFDGVKSLVDLLVQ
ncbi:hypothetical protein HID58_095599, partial [Brassica napus]